VNFSHFMAIVRMRWQTMRNQLRKSGQANWIITIIMLVLAALGSLSTMVFAAGWGTLFLTMIEPFYVIYVWDALAAAFLFAWTLALMVELQRSELLSLKNLLHLPVSLSGAFFLNYTSSLASLTVLLFLPGMIGLCIASVLCFGSRSLVVFALLAAFLFMVTAVSYQLRGWLARLMENKRRRGTVIAVTTIAFILVFQIPTMLNLGNASSFFTNRAEQNVAYIKRMEELQQQRKNGTIDQQELSERYRVAEEEFQRQQSDSQAAETESINRTATAVNAVLPIGWLPYGASSAARGAVVAPWLCVLGMSTIGLGSLALAYRSTMRVYTGAHNREYRPVVRKSVRTLRKHSLLERKVPLLTDIQSVITLATLRSTLRAPEAKMALLSPLIMACVFGSMTLRAPWDTIPELARPWLGLGALAMTLFGSVQLLLNTFGLDRQGFRAYVLMPAARRDILLGKNLGIVPVVGTLSALLIVCVGIALRMQVTHVIASLLQIAIAFCLYFPIGNFTSIVAPIGMAVGTMRPVSMKFSVIVVQFVAMLLVPVAIIPAVFALAAETLISEFGGVQGVPIYLLLTLVELPVAVWLYVKLLDRQGRHLQDREQAILDVISKVAD
jgi:ABC-2 type transport system permease protein